METSFSLSVSLLGPFMDRSSPSYPAFWSLLCHQSSAHPLSPCPEMSSFLLYPQHPPNNVFTDHPLYVSKPSQSSLSPFISMTSNPGCSSDVPIFNPVHPSSWKKILTSPTLPPPVLPPVFSSLPLSPKLRDGLVSLPSCTSSPLCLMLLYLHATYSELSNSFVLVEGCHMTLFCYLKVILGTLIPALTFRWMLVRATLPQQMQTALRTGDVLHC